MAAMPRLIDCPSASESDAGFALPTVLWFLILVAAVVGPFALAARVQSSIQSNIYHLDRLNLLADGLSEVLSARLAPMETGEKIELFLPLDSTTKSCVDGRIAVTVRAQEHAALIDLNAADSDLLAAGFVALGLSADAHDLADAVALFRRAKGPPIVGQTSNVEIIGGPKAGPFESVSELADLAPLRAVSLRGLMSTFTVYSRAGTISSAWAPQPLAKANVPIDPKLRPFISDRRRRSHSLTIEIGVADLGRGIAGYAGYIVLFESDGSRSARRVEKLPLPSKDFSGSDQGSCSALFGTDVAQALAEFW